MVVVSLTTTKDRLHLLRHALMSLIEQTYKADVIVVWVSWEPYLRDRGMQGLDFQLWAEEWLPFGYSEKVEFRICENTGPYRKLLPSLKGFEKDDLIVTADDDIIYGENWLDGLINEYYKVGEGKECVVATRVRKISYNFLGIRKSYSFWPIINLRCFCQKDFIINFGGGAVLSPSLFKDSDIEDQAFVDVCPTADDLWYTAMLKNNGVGVQVIPEVMGELVFLSHDDGLVNENLIVKEAAGSGFLYRIKITILARLGFAVCGNDRAQKRIVEYFKIKSKAGGLG